MLGGGRPSTTHFRLSSALAASPPSSAAAAAFSSSSRGRGCCCCTVASPNPTCAERHRAHHALASNQTLNDTELITAVLLLHATPHLIQNYSRTLSKRDICICLYTECNTPLRRPGMARVNKGLHDFTYQFLTRRGTGNEHPPKCGDALRLGSKGGWFIPASHRYIWNKPSAFTTQPHCITALRRVLISGSTYRLEAELVPQIPQPQPNNLQTFPTHTA